MQTKFFNTAIVFVLLLFVSTNLRATSYTWVGGTDSSWATPANWNPNTGVPSSGDNVTISSPGTYSPNLDGDRTIANFTISGSTLDLKGHTLTVTGSATCSGGTVNNGTLSVSSTSTTTFSGTQFGATLSVRSSSILLNGGIFNSAVNLFKSSSTSSTGTGGCTFNAPVLITDSGTGALTLSNNSGSPDVFNSTLKVNLKIANASVYLAHRGIGNQFNGSVTFSSTAGGHIYSNYYGTATYNDSIILDGLTSNVNFGTSTGTCVQSSGHRLLIGSGGFSSGELHLRNFTQSGTTDTLNLVPGGSSTYLNFESGCVFNSPVNAFARRVFLNGGRFLATSYFSVTGSPTSTGGSYFGAPVTIINDGVSNPTFSADTFATDAMIHGKTGVLHIVNSVFLGNTTFKNGVFLYGCDLKGNVTLDTSGASMHLGDIDYNPTTLYSGVRMTITPAYTGGLNLENFTQLGPDTLYITTQGSSRLTVDTGSIFNGPFVYRGPAIYFDGGTFNNTVDAFVSGSTSSDGKGGCIFNSTVTIKDSCTSPAYFRMAVGSPDMFNGDAFFIRKSTGSLNPVYSANSVFKGNITLDGSAAVGFGTSGNKVIFAGSANQMLNKNGSAGHFFKKIEVNKSAGTLKLNFPLTLTTDTFFLTKGVVLTDATNLLTVPDNGIMTVGSDSAYVCGPLKKVGNDVFTYAIGDTALHTGAYHPLTISAASSTTSSYTAQYFATGQTSGSYIDNTMEQLSSCEYWTLNRNTGTSNVTVKLGWNTNACNVYDPANMKLAGWDGSAWKDKGNGAYTGDVSTGTVTTSSAVSTFGSFTLADNVCTTLSANTSTTDVSCHGGNNGTATAMPIRGTSPYAYSWSNGATGQTATTLTSNTYSVIVTDANGCTAATSATVEEIATLTPVATAKRVSSAEANDGSASVVVTGGTMPYQYLWSNSVTTQTVTGLLGGTYSVTVTDDNGCTGVAITSTFPLTGCKEDTFTMKIGRPTGGGPFLTSDILYIIITPPTGIHLSGAVFTDSSNAIFSDTIRVIGFSGTQDTITLSYGIIPQCDAFAASSLNFLTDSFSIWINQNVIRVPLISDPYSLNNPIIAFDPVSSINMRDSAAPYGTPFFRTYVFINNSGTPFTGHFLWRDTLDSGLNSSLLIDTAEIVYPLSYSNLTYSFSGDKAWIKAQVNNLTDSIVIREKVHLRGCPDVSNSHGRTNLFYGCDSASASLCAKALPNYYETWALTEDKPEINIVELNEFEAFDTIKWLCPSTDELRIIRVINTGTASADSIRFVITRGENLNISYFDTNEVIVYRYNSSHVRDTLMKADTSSSHGPSQSKYLLNSIPWQYRFSVAGPFAPGDTIFLSYMEHKLCLDTMENNFNSGVVINDIDVAATLTHPCSAFNISGNPAEGNGGRGAWGRPIQKFSLLQYFNNYTGVMDDGDVAWLDVRNKNLLSLTSGNQFIYEMSVDTTNLRVQVEIVLDSGLYLISNDSLFLVSHKGTLDTIIVAENVVHRNNGNPLLGDTITATFSLPSWFFAPNTAPNARHDGWGAYWRTTDFYDRFFKDFSVYFKVGADCDYTPAGGFADIRERFFIVYDSACSPLCPLPLASVSDKINILCPGCLIPGYEIKQMSIERKNFGWADVQNDNHPDNLDLSGMPVNRATAAIADERRIMIGDIVELKMMATVYGGSSVNFNNIGFDFTHLWFNFSGPVLSKLRFMGGNGRIRSTTFNIGAGRINTSASPKILDLSLDTIKPDTTSAGLPSRLYYGDTVAVTLLFRVDSNLINGSSYFTMEDIAAILYMSGAPRDSIVAVADADDTTIVYHQLDSIRRYAYWCTGRNVKVRAIGVDFRSIAGVQGYSGVFGGPPELATNYCYKSMAYYASSDLGEPHPTGNPASPYEYNLLGSPYAMNSFPYEVHDFIEMDSISFTLPAGWHVDSVAIRISNLMGDTINGTDYICGLYRYFTYDYPLSMVHHPTNNTVVIYPDSCYSFLTTLAQYKGNNCGSDTLDRGDETKRVFVELVLRMDDQCSTPSSGTSFNYPVTAWLNHQPLNFGGTDTLNHNVSGSIILNSPSPALTSSVNPQTLTVDSSVYTTVLTIRTGNTSNEKEYCDKPFVFPFSQTGNIHVTSMKDGTNFADTANGFFLLPTLRRNQRTNLTALMTYDCQSIPDSFDCVQNKPFRDTLLFIYGCNCYEYPTNINAVCESDTVVFPITICPAGLQVRIIRPDTVRACDTLTYKLKFHSTGNGIVRSMRDTILLPSSLTYLFGSATVEYDSSSITMPTDTSGHLLIWNFNTIPSIDTLGLAVDSFDLVFKVLTSCSYNGELFSSETYALSYCGKNIHIGPDSPLPSYIAPSRKLQRDTLSLTNISCDTNFVSVGITRTNTSGVTNFDSYVHVLLPPNYSFVNPVDEYDTMFAGETSHSWGISIIRGGDPCPASADTVWYKLFQHEQTLCKDSCYSEPLTDSAFCIISYAGYSVSISTSTPSSFCIGGTIELCAVVNNGTPPFGNTWNTADTSTCIYPTMDGTYKVTVVDIHDCVDSASIAIAIDSNCCGNAPNDFPQRPDNSNVSNNTSYNLQFNPFFLGITDVDTTQTWTGDTIWCAPGTQIVVHSGDTLTLVNTHLLACNKMWKGILVKDGGKLIIDNSIIEDAEYGVEMERGYLNNGMLVVMNSMFKNNYVGIHFPDGGGNTFSGVFTLYNTIFWGSAMGSMKPPYSGQPTFPGSFPLAGVIANDVDFASRANTFYNLNCGVYLTTCNMKSTRDFYYDITTDPIYAPLLNLFDGRGVFADNFLWSRTLVVDSSYFYGCDIGIETYTYINSKITNNDMQSGSYPLGTGVLVMYNAFHTTEIAKNTIDAQQYGINLEMTDGMFGARLDSNSIAIGDPTGNYSQAGIRISNFGTINVQQTTPDPRYTIRDNNISVHDWAINGIELYNTRYYTVTHNTVSLSDNANQYHGVSLINSFTNEISCNTITSSDTPFNNGNAAIYSENSDRNWYGCNFMDATSKGLWFTSNLGLASDLIYGNNINNHYTGLSISNLGEIGGQLPVNFNIPANLWNGTCTNLSAEHYKGFPPPYYYNLIDPNTSPGNISPAVGWFLPDYVLRNFECDKNNLPAGSLGGPLEDGGYCGPLVNPGPQLRDTVGDLDLRIAMDAIGYRVYNTDMQRNRKAYLFNKLNRNPDLIFINEAYSDFYNSYIDSPVDYLRKTDSITAQLYVVDSTDMSELLTYNNTILQQLDNISKYVSYYAEITDETERAAFIDSILSFQSIIADANQNVYDLLDPYFSNKEVVADEALYMNSGFGSEHVLYSNQQLVNYIYLNTIAKGTHVIGDDDASDLYTIAVQCPLSGGAAVYQARALYALYDNSVVFDNGNCSDDYDTCGIPASPDKIFGINSGLCSEDTIYQTYRITPDEDAYNYSWYLSDTTAFFVGATNLDSVSVGFTADFDSVILYAVVNGLCGSSEPTALTLYKKPKFPVYPDRQLSVCCADTLTFMFPDSTMTGLFARFKHWMDEETLFEPVAAVANGEDLTISNYADSHWLYYWCIEQTESYLDVEVICSTNPTFIKVIMCGDIHEDTLELIAINECGADTILYFMTDTCYNGDSLDCNQARMAQKNQENSLHFEVYPNPTKGLLTVKFEGAYKDEYYEIEVKDMLGSLLFAEQGKANKGINFYDIDMSNFAKGIYFVNLRQDSHDKMVRVTKQ